MNKVFKIFHYVSFLQYPFILIALYYCYEPIFKGIKTFSLEELVSNYNSALLFIGIGLSFTSLADITKRTKLGDKIFGKRKRAKNWIIYLGLVISTIFILAIITEFFTTKSALKELSVGLFVLGIGMIGILRMNLEIIKSYIPEWD